MLQTPALSVAHHRIGRQKFQHRLKITFVMAASDPTTCPRLISMGRLNQAASNDGPVWGNGHRVFKVGGKASVLRHRGPAVLRILTRICPRFTMGSMAMVMPGSSRTPSRAYRN